jgi:hypothetical protein
VFFVTAMDNDSNCVLLDFTNPVYVVSAGATHNYWKVCMLSTSVQVQSKGL